MNAAVDSLRDRSSTTTPLLIQEEDSEEPSLAESRRSVMTSDRFNIVVGWLLLASTGTLLGVALPRNAELPKWYGWISNSIGYTYFMCWSISFYPQVCLNYTRKSTRGLSVEFCLLNVLGFACYSAYNASLFWNPQVRQEYKSRYGEPPLVQSNDVAFAIHALVLSSVTVLQIVYYNGMSHLLRLSRPIGVLIAVLLATCLLGAAVTRNWLDYLYLLSFIKILISLVKYIPQMILNWRRKSTVGWSIWNILLDFSGGLLSNLQLILDCWVTANWSGITGNWAKLGLGLVSTFFDVIFMLQHYVFYPEHPAEEQGSLHSLLGQDEPEASG